MNQHIRNWAGLPLLILSLCSGSCGSEAQLIVSDRQPEPAPQQAALKPVPPGQAGPSQELLARLQGKTLQLSAKRTDVQRTDGQRQWLLELHQGRTVLASWPALSGTPSSQGLDRRWSPGNGAPLPQGDYTLGPPEPWGNDIWMMLSPRFDTSRSGLGIHYCNPGSGCLCLPDHSSLLALTAWMQELNLNRLRVLN
ncbi:hypothetical protein SynBIOSU31_02416 [Synechococcus sp. BIOS-U3-1]|uniref:hypothetical protein n=1 Tax=Synechococcus sp. BIOS-U3-1 TaxID=1400865 RepID=UPI0018623529|nr:hypothetical protein [Synechococcus sp. BIOS-U3-1]QNI59281.1 hypothetical protein SynBIOSU31_02416 [Synechococcus sp. BIOS-U3-1]|tara:strand:- start:136 stop:723 length:588 start_codon:yes stop_codon:yes gene_type:complete